MKYLLAVLIFISSTSLAQTKPFRFAFISDTHIGSPNGGAEADLRNTVNDINSLKDIAFVVLTGDITELGTDRELALAKKILDSLNIAYYIIPGNHDTGWSESGGLSFNSVFGDDKFHFVHNGMHFIGCASGPYVRMSDGHVPRHHINWLQKELRKIPSGEPVVFLNHYPLDNGLDNWYEVINMLKQHNTVLALCGHGHNNRNVNAEDIPAVMGRSNLRAKKTEGGYNLVNVRMDSFLFSERLPISKKETVWIKVALKKHMYDKNKKYPRPDYSINDQYSNVKAKWIFHSTSNVISTPTVWNNRVVFGNQAGKVQSLKLKNGKKRWSYSSAGPVFSSPSFSNEKLIIGSADRTIYNLNEKGKVSWKVKTDAAVLGSPLIEKDTVFIAGSDGCMQALNLGTGKPFWRNCIMGGAVTSKPVAYKGAVIFGAWDTYLYALDRQNGKLLWKWNNGSPVINYSPAACIPVVYEDVIYIVAPDRYLTAIDFNTGKALWRTKESTVRESIGLSADGKFVYAKTMQDSIVAFHTNREKPHQAWALNVSFGYEHVPSMLIEKESKIFFGTKNGVVYCIDPFLQKIEWAYKIDNSMVNTVNVLNGRQVLASTMDGKVVLLEAH
jgi:outer membrane protein assembly factor BamB/calcineurin-like phosphoesterase family protein